MTQIWQTLKRQVRVGLKFGGTVLHSYPWFYASVQEPVTNLHYNHLWVEFSSPIPQRGSADVRENRLWNLNLAASRLHGLILQPQQILGFWNRVPPPTLANGFREGPVFAKGQVTIDVGGGLCLIATNLYKAFLLVGCQILERHGHSIDPYGSQRFFVLGEDASVAYGYKDLVIRNSFRVPLQLRFEVLEKAGIVRSQVFSTQPCPITVKVESTVLETLPPPTPEGLPGWRVETIRSIANSPSSTDWQVDYRTTTLYQPCQG